MNRRQFIGSLAATALARPQHCAAAPFPVRLRKSSPHEKLAPYILPGNDEFDVEKTAMDIAGLLRRLPQTRALPLASDFRGRSPLPARYRQVASDTFEAEFATGPSGFEDGLRKWLASLGVIRNARYFVLPDGVVRYEIESAQRTGQPGGLEYRVGYWKQTWRDGRLLTFEPVSETLARAARPLFRDVTAEMFGGDKSFR